MKKKIYNIFGLRCLMMAVLAAVCGTSWAEDGVSGSPLAPWWDSNSSGYVLRTIDDSHTVLDAFKALQTINETSGSWSNYSGYTFYLAEDVDLSTITWVPLGTARNPFKSNFYCYTPSYNRYENTASIAMCNVKKDEKEEWAEGYKFTFNNSDIDLSSYYDDIDNFISQNLSNYIVEKGNNTFSFYALGSDYLTLSAEEGVFEGKTPTVEGHKYVYNTSEIYFDDVSYADLNDYLYQSIGTLCYYQISADESTVTVYATEDEYLVFEEYFVNEDNEELTPSTKGSTTIYYPVLPSYSSNPGYYCTEHTDNRGEPGTEVYYSTDGHVGTYKIKNMTVDGSYADGAGFFGNISASGNVYLGGFTFENCSVTNEATNGYAGTLYGIGNNGSNTISVQDLFIGSSSIRCKVKADYAGGVYGKNDDSSATEFSVTGTSETTFDPALDEGYSPVNFAYINFPAGTGVHNKVSATADEAENLTVNATEEATTNYAFGTSDGTESGTRGTGSTDAPFYLSTPEHIQNMIDIIANPAKISTYTDLKDLGITSIAGMNFKQVDDITVSSDLTNGIGVYSDTGDDRKPFTGTYDGNGKTIEVNIKGTQYCALFQCTDGATIKDLDIEGANTATGYGAAGIIGYDIATSKGSTISGCVANVTVSAGVTNSAYGLVAYCSSSEKLPTITNSYNKAAKDLDFCNRSSDCATSNKVSWIVDGNTVGYGEGSESCPMKISSLAALKIRPEDGLFYQLTDNLKVQSGRVYDYIENKGLISGASDNDYYIEKFCGTIDGNAHAISGITDKALFGTIVGNTTIDKVAFVNCYNATNGTVKLANSITDENTLSLSECYADTHFAFTDKATKDNCYEYNNGNVIYYISGTQTAPTWIKDALSHHYILADNCVELVEGSKYTDYCSRPLGNTVVTTTNKDFADYKYYNVTYLHNETYTPIHLYLVDVMDFYNPDDDTYYGLSDEKIAATDFSAIPTGATVESVYYCRKAHNDWESVCLPFTYKLSDIKNSEKFTAYTVDVYASGENKVYFKQLEDNATITAGQPVLFKTDGETDFVVNVSNSEGIEFVTTPVVSGTYFKGALQSTGTGATINSSVKGMYKIDGTATDDGGGTLLLCNEHSWIYPFRAYLDFGGSSAKSINFSIINNNVCDVDGDDNVTIDDAQSVMDAILGGASQKIYDVNGDGQINIIDVNLIIGNICTK